ncbi:hypothetical protein LIER_11246 [Lithospermum erythrorhizon]|uniref:Uncharacterized protein n=1 Tax=Lithospermum erythrorhizon TaxID=34254 RepID=A0AAV3PP34_LITER
MEEGNEDFVGSLLRDSPETTSPSNPLSLDDSQAPLDVMPISSRMGPPADMPIAKKPKATNPKPSKGKSSKEPPTLQSFKVKIVLGLIIEYQLPPIRNYYDIPDEVMTRIPLEGESVDTTSTKVAPSKEVLTVFQVVCLAVGVLPNMALFSTMYNVIHKDPWLISKLPLPPRTSFIPKRWIKLSLPVGSSCGFSPRETQAEVDKLKEGFPNALPHEVFCYRDVLIKTELAKGAKKFPNITLLNLLLQTNASGSCTMPHKVSFKAVTSGKDPLARIFKIKGSSARDTSSEVPPVAPPPKKSKKTPKETPVSEPSLPFVPPESSSTYMGPLLEVPYSLHSGLTVTEGIISRKDTPTASLWLKNYMMKKDMEGVLQYSTPGDLQDSFSHFQLKATECTYGLSLKWRECEESQARLEAEKTSLEKRLAEVLRERDEARACAHDLEDKYGDLQAVRDGLFKSKSDLSLRNDKDVVALKKSLEESEGCSHALKTQLDSSHMLLANIEQQVEQLSLRPTPEAVIERFKEGEKLDNLLIDNTVSIMKKFFLEVYPKFPGIHSMFPEFVGKTFCQEYVVPLTDTEEEEDEKKMMLTRKIIFLEAMMLRVIKTSGKRINPFVFLLISLSFVSSDLQLVRVPLPL